MDELTGLQESVRKLALNRFRLLQPHLEQHRPLRPVAIEAGIPVATPNSAETSTPNNSESDNLGMAHAPCPFYLS